LLSSKIVTEQLFASFARVVPQRSKTEAQRRFILSFAKSNEFDQTVP